MFIKYKFLPSLWMMNLSSKWQKYNNDLKPEIKKHSEIICFGKFKNRTTRNSKDEPRILIIILFVYVTNYPNTQCLKTTKIHYLIDSEGHESESNLAGCLSLRVSSKVAVKLLAGAVLSEGLAGQENQLAREFNPKTAVRGPHFSLALFGLLGCLPHGLLHKAL